MGITVRPFEEGDQRCEARNGSGPWPRMARGPSWGGKPAYMPMPWL